MRQVLFSKLLHRFVCPRCWANLSKGLLLSVCNQLLSLKLQSNKQNTSNEPRLLYMAGFRRCRVQCCCVLLCVLEQPIFDNSSAGPNWM